MTQYKVYFTAVTRGGEKLFSSLKLSRFTQELEKQYDSIESAYMEIVDEHGNVFNEYFLLERGASSYTGALSTDANENFSTCCRNIARVLPEIMEDTRIDKEVPLRIRYF